MPNEEKYRVLIGALRESTRRMEAADKNDDDGRRARLRAGFEALQEVIIYLSGDPEIGKEGLTRPLGLIENALRDAGRGAKPPLLEHSPEGTGSKPSGTTREDVQGGVAAALQVLATAGGWGTAKATEWIVAEARRMKLRCVDGAPIAAKQIKGWRAEMNKGRGPAAAQATFEDFCGYERAKPWWKLPRSHPAKRTEAQRAAGKIIAVLAHTTPQAAPKATARLKQ
jgi:hypothetical protein